MLNFFRNLEVQILLNMPVDCGLDSPANAKIAFISQLVLFLFQRKKLKLVLD